MLMKKYAFLISFILISLTNDISTSTLNDKEYSFDFISLTGINESQYLTENLILLHGGAELGYFSLEILDEKCDLPTKSTLPSHVLMKDNEKFNFPFEIYYEIFANNKYIPDRDSLPGVTYKTNFYMAKDNKLLYNLPLEPTPVNYGLNYIYKDEKTPFDYKVYFAEPLKSICDKGIRLFYNSKEKTGDSLIDEDLFARRNKSIINFERRFNLLYDFRIKFKIVFVNQLNTDNIDSIPNRSYIFNSHENRCFNLSVILHNHDNLFISNHFESNYNNNKFDLIDNSLTIQFRYDLDYNKIQLDKSIFIDIFTSELDSNNDIKKIYHVKSHFVTIEEHVFYEDISIIYSQIEEISQECINSQIYHQNLDIGNNFKHDYQDYSLNTIFKIYLKKELTLCFLGDLSRFVNLGTPFEPNINTSILDMSNNGLGSISILSNSCSSLSNQPNQLLYLRDFQYTTYDINSLKINSKITCGNNLNDNNKYGDILLNSLPDINIGSMNVSNISLNPSEYIKFLFLDDSDQINSTYKDINHKIKSCSNFLLYPGRLSPYYERKNLIINFPIYSGVRKMHSIQIWVTNKYGIKNSINRFVNLVKLTSPLFFPQSFYNICVRSDNLVLNIGFCDCRICERLMNLQVAFSNPFKNQFCLDNFTNTCNCFDASLNESNVKDNIMKDKVIFRTFKICNECKYDSHCNSSLYQAVCKVPNQVILNLFPFSFSLGSPLLKTLNLEPFLSYSLDFGRTNTIKHGGCDCEAYRNKQYKSMNNNEYKYSLYGVKNLKMFKQFFSSYAICYNCLTNNLRSETACFNGECAGFQVPDIQYYTYPSFGPNCNKCLLNGELIQFIKNTDVLIYEEILECTDQNNFSNVLKACSTVIEKHELDVTLIYSSLVTHFRVECPNNLKRIDDYLNLNEAVCIPWLGNNQNINGLLNKKITVDANGVKLWPSEFECLNDNCEPSTKLNCIGECVCYDSCPLGKLDYYKTNISENQTENTINYDVNVPCSGKGICTNNRGCLCDPGYLKPNCEVHCSETIGGCCITNQDCINNIDSGRLECKEIRNHIGFCDLP